MLNYRIALKVALIIILLPVFQAVGQAGEGDTSTTLSTSLQKEKHFKTIKALVRDGRYESAIAETQALISIDPDDERGHIKLRAIYTLLERFEEALEENLIVIEMRKNNNTAVCGDIEVHAMILEFDDRQNEAIEFVEQYRSSCPNTVARLRYGLIEARSRNDKYFPSLALPYDSQRQN